MKWMVRPESASGFAGAPPGLSGVGIGVVAGIVPQPDSRQSSASSKASRLIMCFIVSLLYQQFH
jgi:hypothetical protein